MVIAILLSSLIFDSYTLTHSMETRNRIWSLSEKRPYTIGFVYPESFNLKEVRSLAATGHIVPFSHKKMTLGEIK